MVNDAGPDGATIRARAGWREWLGLVVLTLPMLVLATDLTVLFLAMPSITADLRPGPSQMLWILHVYGFLIAGFLITMGRLGDRIGRRKLLLTGSVAFAGLSVVAAFSTDAGMLIVARALLGVAGATLMPSAFSLLRTMFHDDGQRRFAIAVVFSAFSAGGALGPLIAGVLLELFWWGSVFLVNVPALALLLLVGPLLLPEYREERTHRLDLVSVGLSLGAMVGVVYGLQEIAAGQEGTGQGSTWPAMGAAAAGLVLAVIFVRRQLRLPDPLLELRLFANRGFSTSLGAVLLTGIAMVGTFYLFTQYLQWVLNLSPLQAGLWTVPYVVVNIAGTLLAPALARWVRHAAVIGTGQFVVAVSFALLAVAGDAGLLVVTAIIALAGFGQGVAMALASDLIISTGPAGRAGSAAAMQEVSGELGTALGVAFGGMAGMVAYRSTLAETLPAGVPQWAAESARDGVTGARAAAERLPDPLGPALLDVAQGAFTWALQTWSGIGAVIMVAVATLITTLLWNAGTVGEDAGPAEEERPRVSA